MMPPDLDNLLTPPNLVKGIGTRSTLYVVHTGMKRIYPLERNDLIFDATGVHVLVRNCGSGER